MSFIAVWDSSIISCVDLMFSTHTCLTLSTAIFHPQSLTQTVLMSVDREIDIMGLSSRIINPDENKPNYPGINEH